VKTAHVILVSAIAAAAAAGPSPVFAQTRPSDSVFIETRPDPARGQRLDVTVSSAAGYDKDDSLGGGALGGIGLVGPAGESVTLTGVASYALVGHRTQFRATGATTTRYYGSLDNILHSSDNDASRAAAVGFLYHTPDTTFVANQTANYASSLLYNLLPGTGAITPGQGPAATTDYALSNSDIYSYNSAAEYTRRLTTRNSVSARAEWEHSDMSGGRADGHILNVYKGRAGVSRHVSRNLTALAGYVYRYGDIASGRVVSYGQVLQEHGMEFGVDYRRPLSATRGFSMQLRFGASMIALPASTILVVPAEADAVVVDIPNRRYDQYSEQVSGSYDFGRTWQASGTFRRGIEYVTGLGEPVNADSFTARIDGLLAQRIDFLGTAAYSSGASALNQVASLFDTYTASARFRYGLTRTWATYVEYLYYFYDSRGTLPLVPGLPPRVERNGIRVGLMLRMPAVGKVDRVAR
jgi:hypothetical protein